MPKFRHLPKWKLPLQSLSAQRSVIKEVKNG